MDSRYLLSFKSLPVCLSSASNIWKKFDIYQEESYKYVRRQRKPNVERKKVNARPLVKSSNAWEPRKEKNVSSKFFLLLNQLTVEKFDRITQNIIEELKRQEDKKLLANLVFKKAIFEVNFSEMYARLCESICKLVSWNFLTELLDLCQDVFSKECNESNRKILIGTAKFSGELYNKNMVSSLMLVEYIKRLLLDDDNNRECKIEIACKLLSTIGKKLNTENMKDTENIFNILSKLRDDANLSSRIKCLILEVLELKLNRWITRRKEDKPKTLKEIHREVHLTQTIRITKRPIITRVTLQLNTHKTMTDCEAEDECEKMTKKYVLGGKISEVITGMKKIYPPKLKVKIVISAVNYALDRHEKYQGKVSNMWKELHDAKILTSEDFAEGFRNLYDIISELELDVPDARQILSNLVKSALSDNIINDIMDLCM